MLTSPLGPLSVLFPFNLSDTDIVELMSIMILTADDCTFFFLDTFKYLDGTQTARKNLSTGGGSRLT